MCGEYAAGLCACGGQERWVKDSTATRDIRSVATLSNLIGTNNFYVTPPAVASTVRTIHVETKCFHNHSKTGREKSSCSRQFFLPLLDRCTICDFIGNVRVQWTSIIYSISTFVFDFQENSMNVSNIDLRNMVPANGKSTSTRNQIYALRCINTSLPTQ